MQVNKKSLLLWGLLVVLSTLIFVYGCSSPSTSSISGKLTVLILGEGQTGDESTTPEAVEYPLLLHNQLESDESGMNVRPLRIPEGIRLGRSAGSRARHDFIPDEIIVKYRPGLSYSIMSNTGSGYRMLRSFSGRGDGAVVGLLKLDSVQRHGFSDEAVSERTLLEIERLKALPYVEYAEPNYIYRPLFEPGDEYYGLQWHYPLIKLDMVWAENLVNDVSSVTVAVLDTGIARKPSNKSGAVHHDLQGIFVDEYDFISNKDISLDGDGYDPDATDPGDDPAGKVSTFHGTHVIGTIGALTNNLIGVAGVAGGNNKGVKIMPLRVLGAGGGSIYDIAQAVLYAAGLTKDSGIFPSNPADIINMSLGGSDSDTLKDAITKAYNAGVVIVAAAGNSNTDSPLYPAAYPEVISVSAVDIGATRAWYSNYGSTAKGSKVDLAAPGGDFTFDLNFDNYPDGVLSTLAYQDYNPMYAFYQGTSMAAPHVSGIAALVKQALKDNGMTNPSPDVIKGYLIGNAIDLGDTGQDIYYGYGLLNAYASVAAAKGLVKSPVLFPFPKELRFEGINPPSQSFTLKNIGNPPDISIYSISEKNSKIWVSVSYTGNLANDLTGLTVTVTVNTQEHPEITDGGPYTAMLVVESSAGREYVYVLYNKNGFLSEGTKDIGELYVVAIDPYSDPLEIVQMDVTDYARFYEYTIGGLEAGKYIIGASTDLDGNDILFESNEIFGFYNNGEIIELKAGKNLTGIDFQVNGSDVTSGAGGISKKVR